MVGIGNEIVTGWVTIDNASNNDSFMNLNGSFNVETLHSHTRKTMSGIDYHLAFLHLPLRSWHLDAFHTL